MSASPLEHLLGPLAVNGIGAVFLLAGVIGLFVPSLAQAIPGLSDPATAWTLLAVGVLLDAWSSFAIIQRLRQRKPR